MKSGYCFIATLALTSIGAAQLKHPTKPTSKPVAKSSGPVTEAEAAKVFKRLEKIFTQVLGPVKLPGNSNFSNNGHPATRIAVAREFERFRLGAKPYFKLNFSAVTYDPSRLLATKPTDRNLYGSLIAGGYVSEFSTIPSGPLDSLTTAQFGDAIGFFAARVMEYCHMPSTKWTPTLHKD